MREVLGEVLVASDSIVLAKINDNRMTYELGVSPLRSKAILPAVSHVDQQVWSRIGGLIQYGMSFAPNN